MKGLPSYSNPLLRKFPLGGDVQRSNLHYFCWRALLRVVMNVPWKVRVFNQRYEPADGGVVYICNHQSFIDPILISIGLRRPMNYMARDTLFRVPFFRGLITRTNAFPVRRGTADTGALKEAMRRLKNNSQIVMFAEGTRTRDGRIGPLLPGVAMLARRAAKWTVPVLIDGAFEAWPRWKILPGGGNIIVQYGRPISQEQAREMEPEDFVEQIRGTLIDIQTDVRRRYGRPPLDYS